MKTRLDSTVHRFALAIVRRRYLVIITSVVATLCLATGAALMRVESGYRYFFRPDNPYLVAYDALQSVYTASENILFTVAPASGDVFDADTLSAVEDLTKDGWHIPYATRVDSLANFQHSVGDDDELVVRDLVRDARTLSAEQRAEKRGVALAEPLIVGALLSPDAAVTGVNVNLTLPEGGEAAPAKAKAVAAARALAARVEAEHPGLRLHLTGNSMLNIAFEEAAMKDMGTLTPLMYAVVLLVAGMFLRSVTSAFVTLLVIAMATLSGLGVAGYLGIPLTSPSAASLSVIMTLAVSEPIHIMANVRHGMARGLSKLDAIVDSVRVNFMPLVITNLTTAIGFLSLNASDVRPFADLGNITSIGVAATFVLSLVTLPALLATLPLRAPPAHTDDAVGWRRFARWLTDFTGARRRTILLACAAATVVAGYFVTKNELDERFVSYFDDSTAFRRDTDFTMAHLTGLYRLEYSLPSSGPGGIADPEYLARVSAFADWFRKQPDVYHVQAYSDVIKRLNRNMNGERPEAYAIPGSRELAAQYNLLFEMSLPHGLDLRDMVDVDKSATRFVVTVGDIPSNRLIALGERGEEWLVEHAPAAMHVKAVGQAVMFARMAQLNIRSMLEGTLQAMLWISLTMVIALRSLRLGVLSLLPNLLPAILTFGAWGLLVGRINVALSAVTSISLGIVVDDTVHFMSGYQRWRAAGLSTRDAIFHTLDDAGSSLIVTTVVLVAGFSVLTLSSFGLNADLGRVTAIVLGIGLAADMVMLPALLFALAPADARPQAEPQALVRADAALAGSAAE